MLGAFNVVAAELLARALHELGAEHSLVAHSEDGLYEISVFSPTTLFEVTGFGVQRKTVAPAVLRGEKGLYVE